MRKNTHRQRASFPRRCYSWGFVGTVAALTSLPLGGWVGSSARPVPQSQYPVFWEVTAGKASAYVLGALPFGRKDMFPLDARIERAYEASDRLVVEVNPLSLGPIPLARLASAKGTFQNGGGLQEYAGPETWRLLQETAERVGFPAEVLKVQEPWLVAWSLWWVALAKSGFNELLSMDRYFLRRAQGAKPAKPIMALRTYEDWLDGSTGWVRGNRRSCLRLP